MSHESATQSELCKPLGVTYRDNHSLYSNKSTLSIQEGSISNVNDSRDGIQELKKISNSIQTQMSIF